MMRKCLMNYTSEQLLAIDAPISNTMISAGAGSGKTKVLTERVLNHVIDGIDVDRMLILTFTNAAANEMKRRIRDAINESLDGEKRAYQLNKIDSSYIMTFDAYSLFIVKKYHSLLNVDKDIEVADSNIIDNKVIKIMDEIIEEKYGSDDEVFKNLAYDLCIKSDDDLRDFIIKLNNKLDLIYDRDDYINNYEANYFSDEKLDAYFKQYVHLLKSKLKTMDNLLNEFSNNDDIDKFYSNYTGVACLNDYEEFRNFINNFKIKKKPNGYELSEYGDLLRNKIKDLYKDLKDLINDDERTIKENILDTKEYVLCILDITNKLNKRLNQYKKENNLYQFNDIAKMAIKVIKDNEEIRNEIRDHFKEILIDEYQDTSDIQELFISLISNDNVYVVGDIKQSIYRFRNANPDIFKDKYERYSNGEGYKVDLTNNFRSREEVLSDINIFFNRLMTSNVGGADYKKGHSLNAGNLSYKDVQAENYHMDILSYDQDDETVKEYGKDVVEAFIVAQDIKNKVGKFRLKDRVAKYSDFTILVDRGSKFDIFKKVLTYFKIPLYIETEEKMDESDLMSVLRSIFKLLVEDDKHAFVSLERSFLCEKDDETIFKEISNYYNSDTYNKLKEIKSNIDTKSISIILDEICAKFDVYNKLNKIGDVSSNTIKLDYLYSLASNLSKLGYTYKDFNTYLNNVFDRDKQIKFRINKEDNDAVIMTNYHKSKGLEYNIVYYPCLNNKFNRDDKKGKYLFSEKLGLIIPSMVKEMGLKTTILKKLFNYDYDLADTGEKIRLFYVALTRAKEKMILINSFDASKLIEGDISDDDKLSIGKFSDMLSMIKEDLSPYIKEVCISSLGLSNDYNINNSNVLHLLNKTNKLDVKEIKEYVSINNTVSHFSKSAGLIDKDMQSKLDFGSKMHYYLEILDFNNPDYSLYEDKYAKKLKSFLSSDLMKDVSKAKIYKEYEFIYSENSEEKHGIIDLLLEYDDHFVIIDYKTKNIDDIHYDEQLNGYRKYIKKLSNKDVYCFLYSIVDEAYREVK